jgi:hypothetical protein
VEVGKVLFSSGVAEFKLLNIIFGCWRCRGYLDLSQILIFTPVLIALEIIGNLRRKKVGSFFKVAPFAFRNRGQECGIEIG